MLRWTDDQAAESVLKDMGVTFKTGNVNLADIDWDASRSNHARILGKPIDDDLVEEYALAMEHGDIFPRIVTRKVGKKYVVAGGNHRLASAQLNGAEVVEAYVFETKDDYIADILPRILNRKGGRRTDRNEAYQHALYAINKYGTAVSQAAELFGVSEKTIYDRLRGSEMRALLAEHGVNSDKMAEEHVRNLYAIRENDNVLANTARTIIASKMTVAESAQFIKAVKSARTESARLAVVADHERRLGTKNGKPEAKKAQKIVRIKFLRGLTQLEGVIGKAQNLARLQITEQEEKRDVSSRLSDLGQKCQRLARS